MKKKKNTIVFKKLPSCLEGTMAPVMVNLESGIAAVRELSGSLAMAMPNEAILKSYNDVLELNNSITSTFSDLTKNLKLNSVCVSEINSNLLAPLSASVADIGLFTANIDQLSEFGKINQGIFSSAQNLSHLCLDNIQEQQKIISSGFKSIENIGNLSGFLENVSGSIKMVTGGISEMIHSTSFFPSAISLPNVDFLRGVAIIEEKDIIEHQKKLDDLLEKIDKNFIRIRLGCWETFNRKGHDYIRQSCASMRGLTDEILRFIGPDDQVKKTNYYKSGDGHDKNGKPTRKARIYFALDYDNNPSKAFERLATGLLSAHDQLSAWDHKPLDEDGFVHGILISVEGNLISLLSGIRSS